MNTLKIGQHCPAHKGIYAGIARSYANEPDNHIWLLDAKSPEEYMNWAEATTWAESLGEGTSLPTKHEAALVGCNLTEELGDYGYVWSSTSDGAHRVWGQHWHSSFPGSQSSDVKTGAGLVRAVKRLPITYEIKGHPLAAPAQAVPAQAGEQNHLPLAITSAPECIWLDLGGNLCEEDAHFSNLHDLTWSQDNATGDGIEYVRADLAARGAAQASECGNCFEGETDRGHACRKCGGTGVVQPAAQAQDAQRYRWLREYAIGAYITAQGKGSTAVYLLTKAPALDGIGEETDAAIDAARAAQEKP